MNGRKIVTIILILFVAASMLYMFAKESRENKDKVIVENSEAKVDNPAGSAGDKPPVGNNPADPESKETGVSPDKTIVYYFTTSARCASCFKIENFTKLALQESFADKLKDGSMEFKMVSIEEPDNRHFIQDYKLVTKSVVVSEIKDGKETAHKNLDKIWELLGDEDMFKKYVTGEIKELSGGKV